MPRRNTKLIQLPIAEGMNAGVDPKISELPIIIENGVYSRQGAISKRPGQDDPAVDLNVHGNPEQIGSYLDGSLAFSGNGEVTILSNDGTRNFSAGLDISAASNVIDVDIQERLSEEVDLISMDAMKTTDWTVIAYIRSGGGGSFQTYWNDNGAEIDREVPSSANGAICLEVGSGSGVYRIYEDAGTGIAYFDISSTGVFGSSTAKAITTVDSTVQIDATFVENSGTPWVAVCYWNSSTSRLEVLGGENGDWSTTTTAQQALTGSIINLCCYPISQTEIVVAWSEDDGAGNTDIKAITVDVTTGNVVLGPATIDTFAHANFDTDPDSMVGINFNTVETTDPAGTVFITMRQKNSATNRPYNTYAVEVTTPGASVAAGDSSVMYRTRLATKPMFINSSTSYVMGVYSESWGVTSDTESLVTSQKFLWLSPMSNSSTTLLHPVGKSSIGVAAPVETGGVLSGGGGVSAFALLRTITRLDFTDVFAPDAISWLVNTYEIESPAASVSYNKALPDYAIIAGSAAYEVLAARQVALSGFVHTPDTFTVADAGAGTIAAGTYSILLTYEWTDESGNRHQSAPSPVAESVTIGASRDIDVVLPTTNFRMRKPDLNDVGSIDCVVWMTDGQGGTVYRRATSTSAIGSGDTGSDKTITLSAAPGTNDERLYTTGGVLANTDTPPHIASTIWNTRYVCFDTDNRRIRYSKFRFPGEPFQHNDVLELDIESKGDKATAMEVQSDKLVIFFRDRIYVTEGSGLDDTGGGVNFREPYLVSTDIGCIDQRSIARIPSGIIFESSNGIYILNRAFQLQSIGEPVRHFIETDGPITGTAHLKDKSYVVFSTASGSALVYNWLYQKWSTWSTFASRSIAAINDDTQIARIDDTSSFNYLLTDTANFDDQGSYVGLRLRTGWISKADVGGWYRLKELVIIGQNLAAHTIRVKVAYDFEADTSGPIWVDDDTITPTTLTDFTHADYYDAGTTAAQTANAYALRYQPSHSKCSAFMLEISDEQDSGQTEGWDLSAISILVQPHPVADVIHADTARQITG